MPTKLFANRFENLPEGFTWTAKVEMQLFAVETREIADAKGEKVKHDFVKTKDSAGADTTVAVGEYVKQSETFKPFLGSLYLSDEDKKKIKIPATKVTGIFFYHPHLPNILSNSSFLNSR